MIKKKLSPVLLLVCAVLLAACDVDIGLQPALTAVATTPPATATLAAVVPTATSAVAPTTPPTRTSPPAPTNTATVPAATATSLAVATSTPSEPVAIMPTSLPSSPTPALNASLLQCAPDDDLSIGSDSLGDAYFPQLGNGGYDSLDYAIDLEVDLETDFISGTTTLTALALENLPQFNLDFSGLDIGLITVDGAEADFNRSGIELVITPETPVGQGATFTVVVAYSGTPATRVSGGAPLAGGWNSYENGVFVASEPAGAHNWYPVNDHPCDKATYSLRIDVPTPYSVAANGTLQGVEEDGDRRAFTWLSRDPIASYLVTANIADFVVEEGVGPGNLPMRNYFPRELADELSPRFANTPEMIQLFNDSFGPYPFEAYGVVVADTQLGFALETQTISLFGNNFGGGRFSGEEVVAHELAHQWFGDSVSLKSWKDIWLKEGFATFAQWLWLEHSDGREVYDERIQEMYDVIQAEAPPPPGNPPEDNLYNIGVYLRGGLTLHALRQRLGDDTFFSVMRQYADTYRYGMASTTDFINMAEQVSGQQLDDLFDGWLFSEEMPPLEDSGP